MSSFDRKKNIQDSIKDGLIITATTTRIFYALKAANAKPRKTSMDAMKLAGGICGGVLVKDYASYKTWINEGYTTKTLWPPPKGNKMRRIYPSCFAGHWVQAKGKDCLQLL